MEKSKQIISPRNQFNWMPEIELKELGVCKHPKPADKTSIGYDLYVPRGIFIEPHSRTIVPTNVSLNLPLCVEAKGVEAYFRHHTLAFHGDWRYALQCRRY